MSEEVTTPIKIVFTVQNVSRSSIPFTFAVVENMPGKEFMGEVVQRTVTDGVFMSGEVVQITVPWRFDKFTPFDCAWKPLPGYRKKWFIRQAVQEGGADHGRFLVAPPGGLFE